MAALVAGEKARMYALGGVARGGATRGGYHSGKLFVAINGVHYATGRAVAGQQVDDDSLTISNAKPNRCGFRMRGVVVADGAEVVVTMGTKNTRTREFAGNVLNRTVGFVGTPANSHHQVNAIDFSWALNSRKVTKRYVALSGTAIAQDLIATFAAGYTSTHVEAGLPVLDEITFTDQDLTAALEQLATRLGATSYIDFFRDLHLFTSEPLLTDPRPLLDGDTPLLEQFEATFDASQFISRVFVEGGGVNALTDVAVGETILPVEDVGRYEASGGIVASGPQRLTYTGVQEGGAGSLVGPGVSPATAPTLAAVAGTGLGIGVYTGAYTDVTASGESLPSPLGSVTTVGPATIVPPSDTPTSRQSSAIYGPCKLTVGATYTYGYTFVTAYGETMLSAPSAGIVAVAANGLELLMTYAGLLQANGIGVGITGANYYRSKNGGTYRRFLSVAGNYQSPVYDIYLTDADIAAAAQPPGAGTADIPAFQQVSVAGVALGPTGTTSRKYYRTAVDAAQLKLQQTIANNTVTVGVTDATADGSLGANAPTSDTSALVQPTGQVLAGATSLLLAGAGAFAAAGGWALVGAGNAIRYTGITGNTLTGIPASGPGAIAATISYNSTATAAAALLGIPASGAGSIVYTIKQGDPVNLVAQVDDFGAQALLAALLTTATYTHDGIIEDVVVDGRVSLTEATARGEAQLALRNQIDVSAHVVSRDMNMRMGRTLAVDLTDMGVDQSFTIQSVNVSGFTPSRPPFYDATLSSDLFTFEDLLRMARKGVS